MTITELDTYAYLDIVDQTAESEPKRPASNQPLVPSVSATRFIHCH